MSSRQINPRSAGRFDYRTNKDSEIKHPEVTRKYSLHEEGHVFERTLYDFITDLGETDIEKMETLTKKRFQEALQIHKKPVPVTRAPYAQRWNTLHHNIKTILEPLCDLKAFCVLLQRPENHLKVRSRQQVEKRIPIRTVADMSNEMVQELTEMPKYTAMVKILQGKGVWKGKLNTLPLPHLPISKECREGKDGLIMLWNILQGWAEDIMENNFCKRRSEIDLEIKERQDGWQLKTAGEQPVVRDKNEKGPAGPPYKPVIEPDEPPPPIRPKKPRR